MTGTSVGRRPGIALLMTLLGVLVLEVVIAGAFHVAMQQRRIATSYARGVQLESAARAAAAASIGDWAGLGADSVPVGATLQVATAEIRGLRVRTSVRRVAGELFLLRAEADHGATGETRAVAAILRELTLAEFLGAVQAAAVAHDALIAGEVIGLASQNCSLPAEASLQVPALALADTTGSAAAGGATVAPVPPFARFAGLDLQELRSDPPEMIVLAGDDTLSVNTGPALMVVHGDLTLAAGVRFDGLLLVQGSLRILPGAAVNGAVRAGARLEVTEASISYEPCVLAELFRSQALLRGPLRAASHWWIPAA